MCSVLILLPRLRVAEPCTSSSIGKWLAKPNLATFRRAQVQRRQQIKSDLSRDSWSDFTQRSNNENLRLGPTRNTDPDECREEPHVEPGTDAKSFLCKGHRRRLTRWPK